MTDYSELAKILRDLPHLLFVQLHGHEDVVYKAADAIEALQKELRLCRNELCQHCGEYIREYAGACDGCRWYSKERLEE